MKRSMLASVTMSKRMLLSFAGVSVSQQTVRIRTMILTMVMILMTAIPAQGQIPITTYIFGRITTSNGSGLEGVTVSGHGVRITGETDSSGDYCVGLSYRWSGTLTPYKSGYTFSPPSRRYYNNMSVQYNQNYTAYNGSPPPPPPSIRVTSPNSSESWQRGTSHTITWTSRGNVGSNVRIELYKGGISVHTIIGSTPTNDGSYNWSIPATQTIDSDYKVKITSTSIPTSFDESDDYFSIIGDDYFPIIGDETIFEDSFPSTTINRDKWTFVYGAEVDDKGTNEPSPEYSLHLNGHPSGGDLIESRVIDLSSYSGATLTYYYQRTGLNGNSPEAGEDLIIEYDDGSSWVELDRQLGSGPDMTHYDESSMPLPLDALHSRFKFRLQRDVGSMGPFDDWFVDDVKIAVDANVVTSGSLVAWGFNQYGQCDVPPGNDYVAVSAGYNYCLALKSDGSIVGWGDNDYGKATPPVGKDFVAIAAGSSHSLALKSSGSIVAWGRGWDGEATPPAGNDFISIAAGGMHSIALKSNGSIVCWGHDGNGQATAPVGYDFVDIVAGSSHSLALKSDGSIVGWGYNEDGQATPPAGDDYVAVSAGYIYSLALKSDGSIVGWGANDYGQATPPSGNDFVAISANSFSSLALKSDGSIVAWGYNEYGQATPPAGNHFISIDAGTNISLAISRVPTDNDQRSNLIFCRGGECAHLYADPAAPGSFIGSMELEIQTNFAGRYIAEVTPTSLAGGTWTAWVEPEVLGPGTVTGTLWVRGENLNLARLPNGSGEVQVAEVQVKVRPAF